MPQQPPPVFSVQPLLKPTIAFLISSNRCMSIISLFFSEGFSWCYVIIADCMEFVNIYSSLIATIQWEYFAVNSWLYCQYR